MNNISWDDVQGFLLSGFGHLDHSRFLFVHFPPDFDAQAWLETLPITNAVQTINREELTEAINIAFTSEGLTALGYPSSEREKFAPEFVAGMGDYERARRLGDSGLSDPQRWEIGKPKTLPIHALLILKASSVPQLDKLTEDYSKGWKLAAPAQDGWTSKDDQREHFGFVDGISQPTIEGSPLPPRGDIVPTGEFILGYKNAYGMFPSTPTLPHNPLHDEVASVARVVTSALPDTGEDSPRMNFGHNGTYLVFRKLAQDVWLFRDFVARNAQGKDDAFAAKLVGRWQSGAPLALYPDTDPRRASNDFGYQQDRDGLKCPIGAHVRRANPRDDLEHNPERSLDSVKRHRILRRGVLYGNRLPEGSDDDSHDPLKERGLLFICLNTNIRRQFEFIQQTWLNSSKFGGLRNDRDPIAGNNLQPGEPQGRYDITIQASPARQRKVELPRFVTMRGGGYFFLPSISAVHFLARLRNSKGS